MDSTDLTQTGTKPEARTEEILLPVVLDLGSTKKKLIKALKQGEGPLIDDVFRAVEAVRENMGAELEGKVIVPLVVVYRKKEKRRGLLSL